MDFNYSPAEKQFRQEVRSWFEANLPDDLREGRDEHLPAAERFVRHRAWHKQLHAAGWVGIWWPKEYGGRGASLIEQMIFHQEADRLSAPLGVNISPIYLFGPTLMHWGTEAQKKRYLPKLLSGKEIWCQGYSEPGAGSDLASLQTRAVEDGDSFIVTGQKVWTSQAQYADWCFLIARTDPNTAKHQGISYLLVDMHNPGITVRPLVQITGDAEFNEVFFEEVRVPKHNLVGEKNRGWAVAVTTLLYERATTSGYFRFDHILRQLADLAHRIERNGLPASADTQVRQRLAQFAIEAEALKYNNLRGLTRQLNGQAPGAEGSFSKVA
ncbi:MAG: acyl-CoA dehydrogenase family protein, partial [Candidatus Binatia bacterium]